MAELEMYTNREVRVVVKKLSRYSKEKNSDKLRRYLTIVQESKQLWDAVVNNYGIEWLKDKIAIYSGHDECNNLEDVEDSGRCKIVNEEVKIKSKKTMSAIEFLRMKGIPFTNKDDDVACQEFKDPFEEELLASGDVTLNTTDDTLIDEPSEEEKQAALVILSKVSMDGVKPFDRLEYVRNKKVKTHTDHAILLSAEREEEDRKRKAQEKAEFDFIVKCSTRRYANDWDEEPIEQDATIATEREQYEQFTANVRNYIYKYQFPMAKVVEYMDFCDISEILQFERNNPCVTVALDAMWKRRTVFEFECHRIRFGGSWKETYMGCRNEFHEKLAKTANRIESGSTGQFSSSNSNPPLTSKNPIRKRRRLNHEQDPIDIKPQKVSATRKGKPTPLMAKTLEMYNSAANKSVRKPKNIP